jgi:hypothetical protein
VDFQSLLIRAVLLVRLYDVAMGLGLRAMMYASSHRSDD